MRPPAFAAPGRWFRGNLHAQSDRSDGVAPPEQTIAEDRAARARWGRAVTDTSGARDDGFTTMLGAELSSADWDGARVFWVNAIAPTGIHGWRSAVAEGDPTRTEATLDLARLRSPYWRLTVTAEAGARAWTNSVWA